MKEPQSSGKEVRTREMSDNEDNDDSEVGNCFTFKYSHIYILTQETNNLLTQNAPPPPMKFSRPRGGAGPALRATFKPTPLFRPRPSPEPNISLTKMVSDATPLRQASNQPATLEEKVDMLLMNVHELRFGRGQPSRPRRTQRLPPRRFKPAPIRSRSPIRTAKLVSGGHICSFHE
jgi:hypothetical protein